MLEILKSRDGVCLCCGDKSATHELKINRKIMQHQNIVSFCICEKCLNEFLGEVVEANSVTEGYLYDWYIHSVGDEDPVWTEAHLKELCKDFVVVPKDITLTTDSSIEKIDTSGLAEGIMCAMCTNPMKSNTGCDGGCSCDKELYEKIMNVIKQHIVK